MKLICLIIRKATTFSNKSTSQEWKQNLKKNLYFGKCKIYENKHLCKNEKSYINFVKEKILEDVKSKQYEINMLQERIKEYNDEISENLKILKNLENGCIEDNKSK